MILVAPTALKGTIGARAAATALAKGIRSLGFSDVVELPVSDGGHGLIDALARSDSSVEEVDVRGPLGDPARARLLRLGNSIVIESADACGLHLVPANRREVMRASTFGLGELVLAAARREPSEIVIGLGGSATVDGGIGMAAALGWHFTSARDDVLEPLPPSLNQVAHVRAPAERWQLPVTALVDVQTLLFGPAGAARVFGPQKGATSAEVELLDRGLENYAGIVERDLTIRVDELPGGGAAGGLGAAIRAFLNGVITPGSDWVLEHIGFAEHLRRARLLVTAEGSYDAQSELGKITGTMIARAQAQHIPVLLVAGRVEGELPVGVHAIKPEAGQLVLEDDLTVLARNACSELLPL